MAEENRAIPISAPDIWPTIAAEGKQQRSMVGVRSVAAGVSLDYPLTGKVLTSGCFYQPYTEAVGKQCESMVRVESEETGKEGIPT